MNYIPHTGVPQFISPKSQTRSSIPKGALTLTDPPTVGKLNILERTHLETSE